MTALTFEWHKSGAPIFHADDSRYTALGSLITVDLSTYKGACLHALAILADATAGREPFDSWYTEFFEVTVTPDGVKVDCLMADDRGEYSVDEVRETVEEYWRFLVARPDNPRLIREYRPDLPEWEADLLWWEEEWGRPHPYRGVLF